MKKSNFQCDHCHILIQIPNFQGHLVEVINVVLEWLVFPLLYADEEVQIAALPVAANEVHYEHSA